MAKLTESFLRKIIKEELSKVVTEGKMIPDGRGGFVETEDLPPVPKKSKLKFMPDGRGGGFYVDEKGNVVEPEKQVSTGKQIPDGRGGFVTVSDSPPVASKEKMQWMPDGRGGGQWVPKPARRKKR